MKRSLVASVALCVAVAAAAQKSYSSAELGLQFSYPDAWSLSVGRLGTATFEFALDGGSRAKVDVFASNFRLEADLWQRIQRNVSEQLKRTIDKQWQEEILGVPLLLTRVRYSVGEEPTTTLTGLLYSKTENKMLFRLSAPSDAFGGAETAWREVLISLRPVGSALPQPEDPAAAPAEDPKTARKPDPKPPAIVKLRPEAESRPKASRAGLEAIAVTAAGRNFALFAPKDWTAAGEGRLRFSHRSLKGELTVEVLSTLDAPSAERTLAQAAAASLQGYAEVTKRLDRAFANSQSVQVQWVLRIGKQNGAEIVEWLATGSSGQSYWLARYVAPSSAIYKADKSLIEQFLDRMVVEPAP